MKKLKLLLIAILTLIVFNIGYAANDISGNTWVIDTAGIITSAKIKCVWIYWTGINADGDTIIVREYPSGKVIVKAEGIEGNDMGWTFPGTSGSFSGINVQTLSSGELLFRLGVP